MFSCSDQCFGLFASDGIKTDIQVLVSFSLHRVCHHPTANISDYRQTEVIKCNLMCYQWGAAAYQPVCVSRSVSLPPQLLSDHRVYSGPTGCLLLFIPQRDGSPVSMVPTERQLGDGMIGHILR